MALNDFNDVERERLRKLASLRAAGIDPYPPRAQFISERQMAAAAARHALAHAQTPDAAAPAAAVMGRVVARRVMGKASFTHIEDGSGFNSTRESAMTRSRRSRLSCSRILTSATSSKPAAS
jgi:lysyl-tRNA synthetase class II